MTEPRPPRSAQRLLRRLLPGSRGREIVGELDQEHARRARRHPWIADGWYLAQLVRPTTWRLAEALRRIRTAEQREEALDRRARRAARGRGFVLDLVLSWRMLRKAPWLTLAGVLGIALGTGLGVGFFVVLSNIVSPTLPLSEGDRIVVLGMWDAAALEPLPASPADFVAWRAGMTSVREISAFSPAEVDLVTGDAPQGTVQAARMSAGAFAMVRIPPLLGRTLMPEDVREGAPPVAVLGHDLWQTRFGGDSRVLGRSIFVGDVTHTVVGVMPPGFAFPRNQELWTPLGSESYETLAADQPIMVAGRLGAGVTLEQAQAEFSAVARTGHETSPEAPAHPRVLPFAKALGGAQGLTLWDAARVQLVVLLLLVVIAANIAVLTYARIVTRQSEIALRTALGASRRRIVSQLSLEALLLSAAGALLGLGLAHVGLRRVEAWLDGMGRVPFWADYGIQPGAVAYALVLALVAALVIGVLPGLKATGRGLDGHLRGLGAGSTARLGWVWTTLIVAQVAVTVAVLPTVVSIGHREIVMAAVRPTFPAGEILFAEIGMGAPLDAGTDAPAYRRNASALFAERLTELELRLEAEPMVRGVTIEGSLPGWGPLIEVEGIPGPADHGAHRALLTGVQEDYFEVLGVPLLAGRVLRSPRVEAPNEGRELIASAGFVRSVLRDAPAIGQRVRLVDGRGAGQNPGAGVAGPWHRIVGVVEDLQASALDAEWARPLLFYPVSPGELQSAALLVSMRTGDPEDFAPQLRRTAAALDPDLRFGVVANLADMEGESIFTTMVSALLIALGSVLLLSAAGIHALTSVTVTQRRREIGIRAALGIRPLRLLASIFSRAAWQLGLGGLVGAILGGLLLSGSGRPEREAVLFLGAVLSLMLLSGLLATLGPARRGLSIQPMETLKDG